MKIGIISDTHDDITNTKKAIEIFEKNQVDYVIHCGDYVFPPLVKEFERLTKNNIPFVGVLGNNDGEQVGLLKIFDSIGAKMLGEIGELEIDGLKFGIYHGTNNELKDKLISSERFDVFVSGHTHKHVPPNNSKQLGKTLVFNPGTAHRKEPMLDSRNLFAESTVLVFDTVTKNHEFFELD